MAKKPANRRITGRYQLKIALSYIAIIVLMLVLLNSYPVLVSRDFLFRFKQESLTARADLIASSLSSLETLNAEDVGRVIEVLGDRGLSRIVVTDAEGLVVFDNAASDNARQKYVLLPEIFLALAGKDVFVSRYEDAAFESRVALPIMNPNGPFGAVYLYEYDADQAKLIRDLRSNIGGISVSIASVVIILSILMSSALARRVGALLRAIRLVREGEYSHRVLMRGRDELAFLADEFNALTGRLQKTENARRQFVSDASHELKTPLASIRLLTDSILQTENMETDTIREFVADIGDESDRLARMTEKLLALTRLDAGAFVPMIVVDLRAVASRVARRLTPLAEHYEVAVRLQLDEGCLVRGNEDDIFQAVFNLMENAIKYNKPGGLVRVSLRTRSDRAVLVVDDTGMGIPSEDLSRVFERFYRVDKARSREAGGGGLGLSIVQKTIEQYEGDITLDSRLGIGTCVTVSFPLAQQRPEDVAGDV
ncbi:MAG: HAMP domain-containing protein [Oscillospiraceae bacterium]|jgi:signal transduction histidine kinase|nr:HAMP domain-containing protein [Oscillospiraceae bacterium]